MSLFAIGSLACFSSTAVNIAAREWSMPLTARRAARRCRQQRLNFPDERTLPVQRHRDRGPGDRCRSLIQEQAGRVGDVLNPVVVQHETADLVGRTESILD